MATIRDLLVRKGNRVLSIRSGASVLEAAMTMNEHGIGGLVVQDEDHLVGMITERDLLRRVIAQRKDPATTPVGEVMTAPVQTATPAMTVDEAAALMTMRRIRHLPVEHEGVLEGMITIGDLLAFQVSEQQATIQYMNSFIYENR